MSANPSILLSAFGDEAANNKSAVEQLSVLSALGLSNYSVRFIDVDASGTVGHVVDLTEDQLANLRELNESYGMSVTSIGARIGKVKLLDVDDGSHNKYVEFSEYLDTEVAKTIRVAQALGSKLVRGFSFYHPAGTDAEPHIEKAAEQVGAIADACAAANLVFGLEIEPNLVGQTGPLQAELARAANRPNLLLIYDAGNVAAQNKHPMQCYEEYLAQVDYMGWMHIKDYEIDPSLTWDGAIDEERLKNFVPANAGDGGHELILRHMRNELPRLNERVQALGLPGVYLEAEPHLKAGGQFGGFSGPDGMGVAVRALCRVLDYVGIDYDLRNFDDIRAARGF